MRRQADFAGAGKTRLQPLLGEMLLWTILLCPLPIYLAVSPHRHVLDIFALTNITSSVLWAILIRSSTGRDLRLHSLLLPFYVITAVDVVLLRLFESRLTASYIGIALSEYKEAAEFIGEYFGVIASSFGIVAIGWILGAALIWKSTRTANPQLALFCAVALISIYGAQFVRNFMSDGSGTAALAEVASKEQAAPVGFLFQAAVAGAVLADTREYRAKRRLHHPAGKITGDASAVDIVVWVIGESSRPQNWSIFGYPRRTNKRLEALKSELIAFPGWTTAPHTALAVPSMLSLIPMSNKHDMLSSLSVVSSFSAAGYQTYWISTQPVDSWAGMIGEIALEASHRRFIERSYDMSLVDALRDVIHAQRTGQPLFVVLHSRGSHFQYERRYPPQDERFKTSQSDSRQAMIDRYDNSVAYTDTVLAGVIDQLKKIGGRSLLVYTSDHGENLMDDQRKLLGHAQGTEYDLAVPILFWMSDRLSVEREKYRAHAERNGRLRPMISDLSHSILHVCGIESPGIDITKSVFSEKYKPTDRVYEVRGELKKLPATFEIGN